MCSRWCVAYAQVYKGLWNEVQDVAVKMVVGQSAEQQARFLREVGPISWLLPCVVVLHNALSGSQSKVHVE